MSDCFIGEIRLFAFGKAPRGWALCSGQLISISTNEVLYSLIGTIYGGDGRTTFGLPDLRGRVPIAFGTSNQGNVYSIGQAAGTETDTLLASQMPTHSHALTSTTNQGTTAAPGPNVHLATVNVANKVLYAPANGIAGYDVLAPCVGEAGSGTPHENMMPSLTMNFCIALEGIYPSRS